MKHDLVCTNRWATEANVLFCRFNRESRQHLRQNTGFSPSLSVMSAGYFSFIVIKQLNNNETRQCFIQRVLVVSSTFSSTRSLFLHVFTSLSLSLCQHFSCPLTFSNSLAPPRSLSFSLALSFSLCVSISAKSSTQLSVVCPEPIKQSSTKWQLIHSFGFWFFLQSTRTYWSSGYMVWIHCIQLQSGAKSSSILLKAAMKHLCVEWICSRLSVNTHSSPQLPALCGLFKCRSARRQACFREIVASHNSATKKLPSVICSSDAGPSSTQLAH